MQQLKEMKGALAQSLVRNASKIREDRALMIVQSAEKYMRRRIEDLEEAKSNLAMQKAAMLDMSPSNVNSIISVSDFDAKVFCDDIEGIVKKDYELTIQINALKTEYQRLFGEQTPAEPIAQTSN